MHDSAVHHVTKYELGERDIFEAVFQERAICTSAVEDVMTYA